MSCCAIGHGVTGDGGGYLDSRCVHYGAGDDGVDDERTREFLIGFCATGELVECAVEITAGVTNVFGRQYSFDSGETQ